MSDTPDVLWVGWFRVNSRCPWEAVCRAASAELALDRLLDHPGRGDRVVLRDGVDPNKPSRLHYSRCRRAV